MIEKLICYFKGHSWKYSKPGLYATDFKKCRFCGKFEELER